MVTPAHQEVSNIHDHRSGDVGGWVEFALFVDILDLKAADLVLKKDGHCPKICMCGDALGLPEAKKFLLDCRVMEETTLVRAVHVVIQEELFVEPHSQRDEAKHQRLEVGAGTIEFRKEASKARKDFFGDPNVEHPVVGLVTDLERLLDVGNLAAVGDSVLVKDHLYNFFAADTTIAAMVPTLWRMGGFVLVGLGEGEEFCALSRSA
jgi:hypothetical protein